MKIGLFGFELGFFGFEIGFVAASAEATPLQFGFVLPVEMAVMRVTQINITEKRDFWNLKKRGEIEVIL